MLNRLLTFLGVTLCMTAAQADPSAITGTWVGNAKPERLIFKSNGYLRTCISAGSKGNAAMGSWSETQPGKIRVEFAYAISPSCDTEPRVLYKYQEKIVGQARVTKSELALFVSGEFPPDTYQRLAQ